MNSKLILLSMSIFLSTSLIPLSYAETVPSWVKNTAGWWATDAISETEFVNAIEFLVQTNLIHLEKDYSSLDTSLLLTWNQIVNDAVYANNGSLEIRDHYFQNSDIMLTTKFDSNKDTYLDHSTYDLLNSGLALYRITGSELYLDQARYVANNIEDYFILEDGRVAVYSPITKQYLLGHNQEVLQDVANLALIDRTYVDLTKILADRIIQYEINSETNLLYNDFNNDGTPKNSAMYMSYRGAVGLESLMLAYEVTEDKKYLEKVKKTLLTYWSIRNSDTNLIPGSVNTTDLSPDKEFMQQYGAGIFLKLLLHYYYLTDDPEILIIMNTYADAVIKNFWDGHTWNYRVNYDGSILSPVVEGNYAKLDNSLILLDEVNLFKSNFTDFAKKDYDNSFQKKLSVVNDLIIHSVKDDGTKDSPQSMMQYGFIINQNIGIKLFQLTNDPKYLSSLNEFYHSIIKNHKRELGYIYGIDAYTLEDTPLGYILNQRATSMIANKINLSFAPVGDVKILWTKIGNHELSEPFISTFDDSGRFNLIHFNYNENSIIFEKIQNSGKIIFSNEIDSVFVNGLPYENFELYTLNTLNGSNQYKIILK